MTTMTVKPRIPRRVRTMQMERTFQPFANCVETEYLIGIQRIRLVVYGGRAPIWTWRAVAFTPAPSTRNAIVSVPNKRPAVTP